MAFITLDTSEHGPFFDRVIRERVITDYRRNLEEDIGNRGVTLIRVFLGEHYMYLGFSGGDPVHNPVPHDPGYYQSRIQTERAVEDAQLIRDDRVVYGPWLEGVSSRNFRVMPGRIRRGLSPRFSGYHAFREIAQVLDAQAEAMAEDRLPLYLEELNGRE